VHAWVPTEYEKNNTAKTTALTGIIQDATKENGKWWLFGHWPHLKISSISKNLTYPENQTENLYKNLTSSSLPRTRKQRASDG
jgi:hypothetical protein